MPKITNIKNANFIVLVIAISCFVAFVGRLFPELPVTIVRWIFILTLGTLLLQGINQWVVFSIFSASLLGQLVGHWDWLTSYRVMKYLMPFAFCIPIALSIWRENVKSK